MRKLLHIPIVVAACVLAGSCAREEPSQLASLQEALEVEQVNLSRFDDLDFNVFGGQQWDLLAKTHASDVVVHWPDGRVIHGLDPYTEELKAFFVWAPDTRITDHPVKVANGEWTAVTAVLEGTFTHAMPVPGGTTIAPTGRAFRVSMATFGHWKDGVMDEVHVFLDHGALYAQLGVNVPRDTPAVSSAIEEPYTYRRR